MLRQLHAEVDAQGGADPTNEDPDALGPVQKAITETLRLYPPGCLLTRRSGEHLAMIELHTHVAMLARS